MSGTNNKYLFCNGLPVSRASFDAEARSSNKDFIRHFIADRIKYNRSHDWRGYERHLVRPYQTMKKAFGSYGFEFLDECSSSMLGEKMAVPYYGVIIFFSHCIHNDTPDEAVECFDGLIPSEKIVSMMPDSINRIYDFSVCRPGWLVKQANLRKPNNIIGASESFIPLNVWLLIYTETFSRMVKGRLDFTKAFHATIRAAYNNKKQISS
ncbi:MAG TPA: hypothetical protein VKR53_05565 [Puia sp.]|nr:hypothetical protein [Puia sp.]